jgi:hypothetical protein
MVKTVQCFVIQNSRIYIAQLQDTIDIFQNCIHISKVKINWKPKWC